jgi:hypothetical protein
MPQGDDLRLRLQRPLESGTKPNRKKNGLHVKTREFSNRSRELKQIQCERDFQYGHQNANKVIIENRFEPSNHDHLGKLVAHASRLQARTIIWIVEEPNDEREFSAGLGKLGPARAHELYPCPGDAPAGDVLGSGQTVSFEYLIQLRRLMTDTELAPLALTVVRTGVRRTAFLGHDYFQFSIEVPGFPEKIQSEKRFRSPIAHNANAMIICETPRSGRRFRIRDLKSEKGGPALLGDLPSRSP